jgi:kynurenine formamidase
MPLQAGTQWDGLAHVSHNGKQYGGLDHALTTTRGAAKNGIEHMSDKIVSRAVFCDFPRHFGVEALEQGYAITTEDLDACLAANNVVVGEGDILLVRTGHLERCRPLGWKGYAYQDAVPGLGIDTVEWIHEHKLAAVGGDTSGLEVKPSQVKASPLPFHTSALVYMGLLIGEIFDMEELSENCAKDGRYEFMFVAAPLPISGAVGSPINPYVIK